MACPRLPVLGSREQGQNLGTPGSPGAALGTGDATRCLVLKSSADLPNLGLFAVRWYLYDNNAGLGLGTPVS